MAASTARPAAATLRPKVRRAERGRFALARATYMCGCPANAAFDADISTSSGTIDVDSPIEMTVQGRVAGIAEIDSRQSARRRTVAAVRTGSGDIHIAVTVQVRPRIYTASITVSQSSAVGFESPMQIRDQPGSRIFDHVLERTHLARLAVADARSHALGADHAGHRLGPGVGRAAAGLRPGPGRMRAACVPEHGQQRHRPVAGADQHAGRRTARGQEGQLRTRRRGSDSRRSSDRARGERRDRPRFRIQDRHARGFDPGARRGYALRADAQTRSCRRPLLQRRAISPITAAS